MAPKVSVLIPTYNRKVYLRETLESVFAQTYKDYEVVVVDDGSTDGTTEMIKNAGYNVRYYWTDHKGQPAARNRLIKLAQGEYITFLDSDDLLFPDAVERLMGVMDAYGPDVFAYGSYIGVDEDGNEVRTKQRKLPSGNIVADLFEFIYVKSCGTMCAKRIYEQEGGFDASLRRCAVYKFLLMLSLRYKFIPVDGPMYKKRRHKDNLADRSFAGRNIELEVLENFYFNGGGKEVIPRQMAMKRLSQEGYRAGRYAIREGMYEEARRLLSQSFRRHPNIKSLIHWIKSLILKPLICSSEIYK
jgi:glycosyltransferase involved in cell wall biosynthesis